MQRKQVQARLELQEGNGPVQFRAQQLARLTFVSSSQCVVAEVLRPLLDRYMCQQFHRCQRSLRGLWMLAARREGPEAGQHQPQLSKWLQLRLQSLSWDSAARKEGKQLIFSFF